MAGMSEGFRARGEQFRRLAEYQEALRLAELTGHVDAVVSGSLTGTVNAPIEAQAREVTPTSPSTHRRGNNRHAAYCVSLAFPAVFAVWSVMIGDLRLAMTLLLMTLFMALVGLFTLDGPA